MWHWIQGQGLCEEEDGGGHHPGEGAQVQGVHGEGDRLRLPGLRPLDDLHLLWTQISQLPHLPKADCKGCQDIQDLIQAEK